MSNLRIIASKLKNSPKQLQNFEEMAKGMNENYLKLKRDIYIRWNSTYEMIERSLKMRKVIDMLCFKEDTFKEYAITDDEWQLLSKICEFIKIFYESTNLLSGQRY